MKITLLTIGLVAMAAARPVVEQKEARSPELAAAAQAQHGLHLPNMLPIKKLRQRDAQLPTLPFSLALPTGFPALPTGFSFPILKNKRLVAASTGTSKLPTPSFSLPSIGLPTGTVISSTLPSSTVSHSSAKPSSTAPSQTVSSAKRSSTVPSKSVPSGTKAASTGLSTGLKRREPRFDLPTGFSLPALPTGFI